MCFLDTSETNGGRLAKRNFHDWILPRNVVFGLFFVGIIFLFIGIILFAIGAVSSGAVAAGAVFVGLGGCCLLICLLLSLHAYCIWYVRDQETQTTETIPPSETIEIEQRGFITPDKPSSLRRNGKPGYKKVTMSPDIQVADKEFFVQDQPQRAVIQDIPNFPTSPHIITYIPAGQRTSTPEKQHNVYNARSSQPSQQPLQQLHQQPQPIVHTPGAYITQADKVDSLPQQYRSETAYPVKPYASLPPSSTNQNQMFSHYSQPNTYDSSPKFPVEARYFSSTLPNKSFSHHPGTQSHQRTSDASSYSYSSAGHTNQNQIGTGSYGQSTQFRGPMLDLSQTRLLGNEDYDNTVASTSLLSQSGDQKTWRQLPVHHIETNDELPEPTPLQYPSAKRPMTFEQQSSSKMSIYENMLVE